MRIFPQTAVILGLSVLFLLPNSSVPAAEEERLPLTKEEEAAEVATLIPGLFHKSPVVQRKAIKAIRRYHRYHHLVTPEIATEEQRESCFLYRDGVAGQILMLASGGDIEIRTTAIFLLPTVPVAPEERFAVLAAGLESEQSAIREAAAAALAELESGGREATAKLHELLDYPDEETAITAAYALARIEGHSERIGAMLVKAFPVYSERMYADLETEAHRGSRMLYFRTYNALEIIAPAITQALLDWTRHDSVNVRRSAYHLIGRDKEPSSDVYQCLVQGMSDEDEGIRSAARESLTELPPSDGLVVLLLDAVSAIHETSSENMELYYRVLDLLRSSRDLARPYVAAGLSHENWLMRMIALGLVESSGATGVLDQLVALLEDSRTRGDATVVIGKLGKDGALAADALVRLYRSEYEASLRDAPAGEDIDEKNRQENSAMFRVSLIHAIASISPDEKLVSVLRLALSDYFGGEDENPAVASAWELSRMGSRALPVLKEMFRSKDVGTRAAVARAYARQFKNLAQLERESDADIGEYFREPYPTEDDKRAIRRDVKTAIPEISTLLYEESWVVRHDAVSALSEIGPDSVEALPALLDCFDTFGENNPLALRALINRLDPSVELPKDE